MNFRRIKLRGLSVCQGMPDVWLALQAGLECDPACFTGDFVFNVKEDAIRMAGPQQTHTRINTI